MKKLSSDLSSGFVVGYSNDHKPNNFDAFEERESELNNLFKQLKNSEATKAIEIENKIWKIWSIHPSNDRRGYRLTELLAPRFFFDG